MQLDVNRAVGLIVRGKLRVGLPGRSGGQKGLQILDGVMRIVQPLQSARSERRKTEDQSDGNNPVHAIILSPVERDVKVRLRGMGVSPMLGGAPCAVTRRGKFA